MPLFKLIKLKNLTPLHIGTGKEYYDFSSAELQSDTLSSAIASLRAQNGKDNDIESFLHSFTLSSAFPYVENHFYLPKMNGKIQVTMEEEEHIVRKQLKKVRYVEKSLWSELAQGKPIRISRDQMHGEFLTETSNFHLLFKSEVHQRVSVPRGESAKTEPFFFEWKFFNPNSGLYFFVDSDDSLYEEIVSLFKQLGEIGLGTDKNIGGGKFEVESDTLILPEVKDPNFTLLLSLYIPSESELKGLNLPESKYSLQLRGGFIAGSSEERFRHLRKRPIYRFGVGSLFPVIEPLYGKVVDLKPDWNDGQMHSVFKSGRPFYLPVKVDDNE